MRIARFRSVLPCALAGTFFLVNGCNCGGSKGAGLLDDYGIPGAPSQLNFGNVELGQTVRLPVQIANTGTAPLNIASQTVSGAGFSEPVGVASMIPAGGKSAGWVAFAPTEAGPSSGTLTLGDDGDPAQVVVALVGTGLAFDVAATPASLNFGPLLVGTTSPAQTVTLINNGPASIDITFSTSGTASEYQLTDPEGNALATAPVQLAPSEAYAITIAFSPDAVSIFNSSFSFTPCADLTMANCLAPQSIALSGQGITGQLSLAPNPITFSAAPEGASVDQTVTVSNSGSAPVTVTCLYLQSLGPKACGEGAGAFTLGTPSKPLPTALPAGGSFTFSLTYQSGAAETASDVLSASYVTADGGATSTANDPISANRAGTPCSLAVTPSSLNFSTPPVGTSVSQLVTLTNAGGAACQISAVALAPSSDPGYTLASGQVTSLTLPANGIASIGINFTLTDNGPPDTRLGTLDFQSNDPSQPSVQVPLLASQKSQYAGGGAWPKWHHDNLQSGRSPVDTSALTGTVAWTFPVGVPQINDWTGMPTDYLNSPVVGADGTVFQLGMNGTVYAVNPDGGQKWSSALEGPVADSHVGTPIVLSDGSLFVAFGDVVQASGFPGAGSYPYAIYHLNSRGNIIGAVPPAVDTDGLDLPPSLTNGGLLLGADDAANAGTAGAFAFQFDGSGAFVMDYLSDLTDLANPAIIDSLYADQISSVVGPDDTTYWCTGGSCDSLLPPATGFTERQGWPISPTVSATSDLALDQQFTGNLMILFGGWTVGGMSSNSQQLLSVSPATGVTNWTLTLPPPGVSQQEMSYQGISDATVGNSCPAIGGDGTVYVGNFDGLHAVDGATGKEKSGFPFITTSNVLTAPAVGADGTVFFGTADGTFYAITAAGALRFKVTAGGRIAGSPAIGPDGSVYFTANDGYLYAVH